MSRFTPARRYRLLPANRGLHRIAAALVFLLALATLLLPPGCAVPQLMPTPNLYARGDVNPFAEVPPTLQNNHARVLYLTDRQPENASPENRRYGYKRSRSLAFGISEVHFGNDVTWDQLVQASRSSTRSVDLPLTIAQTTELGRFPPTPRLFIESAAGPLLDTQPAASQAASADLQTAAEDAFRQQLAAQLALSPVKEVYIFVHGYNCEFADSVRTIAELWHFFGRNGVPIAYSWPAGRGGLLRGYTYDRESGEFTVFHLKEMLRLIASCPDVQKVHLIAHSRGTDVAMTALRELHLEITGSGRSTRQVLKLGTVTLAAPDLDVDVVLQRMMTVHVGQVPEQFALYTCANDKALGISNWLFNGIERLGQFKPGLYSTLFSPQEIAAIRQSRNVQIIDARISDAGAFGHDYFHSNPAVSSDLILLIRYHLPPGAEFGRPLTIDKDGFWSIDDRYPLFPQNPPSKEPPK